MFIVGNSVKILKSSEQVLRTGRNLGGKASPSTTQMQPVLFARELQSKYREHILFQCAFLEPFCLLLLPGFVLLDTSFPQGSDDRDVEYDHFMPHFKSMKLPI